MTVNDALRESANAFSTRTGRIAPDVQDEQRMVIVVDDSDEVRDVLTMLLEGEGFRVLPVEDGESALIMARRARPALITLDIRLPGEDGAEVLRRLKSDPDTSDIPVIVLSGQDNMGEIGESLGADGVLGKPFELEDVQNLVRSLMRRVP